jgi:carbon-monoxide dehydrogenase medium subunit
MLEKLQEYVTPKTIPEAIRLLRAQPRGSAVAINGSIDVHWPRLQNARRFVDTSRLGLSYIRETKTHLKIGAATPIEDIVQSKACARFAGGLLREAALTLVSPMRRCETSVAALIINVARTIDLLPALMALDGSVVVHGTSKRSLALRDLFAGKGRTVLDRELLLEVVIPKPKAKTGTALERHALTPSDAPMLMTAVTVRTARGKVEQATIAVGGGLLFPMRALKLEKEIKGKPVDMGVFACIAHGVGDHIQPINDARCSADHRREVCRVLVRRALTRAAGLGDAR